MTVERHTMAYYKIEDCHATNEFIAISSLYRDNLHFIAINSLIIAITNEFIAITNEFIAINEVHRGAPKKSSVSNLRAM